MKYHICVELGGTNLRYAVIDRNKNILCFYKISTCSLSEAEDKAEYFIELIKPLFEQIGSESVCSISMALSSLMDKERTTILSSPMVKGFHNIPIVEKLEREFNVPVFIEKDVNILLLYEINRSKEQQKGIIAGVFIGTGLGNAICIDGEIYKGSTGAACELGHISIPHIETICGCGKKGCIEMFTCGKILQQLANEKYHCPVEKIFVLYGDREDVKEVVYYAAVAIAAEITILDPNYIILGGGVVGMEDFPLEYLEQCVSELLRIPNPRDFLTFVMASGDDEAGVMGAAMYAEKKLNSK